MEYVEDVDEILLPEGKTFPPDNYTLTLHYSGNISTDNKGFYVAYSPSYPLKQAGGKFDPTAVKHAQLLTTLEATFARQLFPCFDEPTFKATFQLSVIVDDSTKIAISNTPVSLVVPTKGGWLYEFEQTPKMSTYLLAFAIGCFEHLEATTKSGVKLRIYTPMGRIREGKPALEMAVKAFEFFEEYFQIPYPLKKLDFVAAHEMHVGGMENWGCIIIKGQYLLADPLFYTLEGIHYSVAVVTHEISHMWYGNIVTMAWWNNLWLNEGFARYMEYFATNELCPNMGFDETYHENVIEAAMKYDADLAKTHPVQNDCKKMVEIEKTFDSITYAKAACLIRMLVDYAGSLYNFKKVTQLYLKTHLYKNTVVEDLWNAFGKFTDLPIEEIMETWLTKPGYFFFTAIKKSYPIIYVERDAKDPTKLLLKQQKYVSGKPGKHGNSAKWNIPVKISGDGITPFYALILESEDTAVIDVEKTDATKWVLVNSGHFGYYRVHYSNGLLELLLKNFKALSPADKFALLIDQLALVEFYEGTEIEQYIFEREIPLYARETNYLSWIAFSRFLEKAVNWLSQDNIRRLSKILTKNCEAIYKALGGIGSTHKKDTQYLMLVEIARWLGCFAHNSYVLTDALSVFKSHKVTHWLSLNPNVRAIMYQLVCYADQAAANDLALYYTTPTLPPVEKVRILVGLANTRNIERERLLFILKEFLLYNLPTYYINQAMESQSFLSELLVFIGNCIELHDNATFRALRIKTYLDSAQNYRVFEMMDFMKMVGMGGVIPEFDAFVGAKEKIYTEVEESKFNQVIAVALSK